MGARRDFPIDADYSGGRLETFLRRRLGLPRTLALKACRKGWIRLSGKRCKPDVRLEPGSVVTVTNPALQLPGLDGPPAGKPVAHPIDPRFLARVRASVRFADERLVVSAKPAGEVVHAGTGHAAGWVEALQAALSRPDSPPEELVPIGRLDRDTSGLLAVARGRAATRALFDLLKAGKLARTYTALVLGRVPQERGEIALALEKLEGEDGREQVVASESGKESLTRFRVVERFQGATLLSLEIETGRTHQIRAHLASIGHPVLGDPRQGGTLARAGEVSRRIGLGRLFLHAGRLEVEGWPVFEEPLPQDLAGALGKL